MSGRPLIRSAMGACFAFAVLQGHAGAVEGSKKAAYTLFDPTPVDDLRDFAPDRPTRAIGPTTVDAGHFQIESDFLAVTQTTRDGAATHAVQLADPVLKLGLTDAIDIELTLGGYNAMHTNDVATGAGLDHAHGYGDTTITTKINLLGNDGGDVAFALAPYLLAPTGARGISDGQFEGGLIAPLTIKLPQDFGLTLQTEFDALANENGPGTHAAFTNVVGFNHTLSGLKDVTAYAEFYSRVTTERHGDNEYSADVALAYQLGANTQLDVGANFGLNRGAPDSQVYTGIAERF